MTATSAQDARPRHLRSLVDLAISQLMPIASATLVTFVTAAVLGPSGRGALAFVLGTSALVSALGYLSLHVGVNEAVLAGDGHAPSRGLRVAFMLALAAAAVVALLPIIGLDNVGGGWAIAFASVGTLFTLLNLFQMRTIQALGDDRFFRHASTFQATIMVVGAITVAAVTHRWEPVAGAWLIATIATTAFTFRRYRCLNQGADDKQPQVPLVRSSSIAHVGFMGPQLMYRADVVILGLTASAAGVGLYSIAAALAGLVWPIAEALSLAAYSRISRNRSGGSGGHELGRLLRINGAVALIAVPAILLATTAGIPWLLPQFEDSVVLVWILMPGVVLQGFSRIVVSGLIADSRSRASIGIGVISGSLALLYIPACITGGIAGAAICSTIIYSIQAAIVMFIFKLHRRNV